MRCRRPRSPDASSAVSNCRTLSAVPSGLLSSTTQMLYEGPRPIKVRMKGIRFSAFVRQERQDNEDLHGLSSTGEKFREFRGREFREFRGHNTDLPTDIHGLYVGHGYPHHADTVKPRAGRVKDGTRAAEETNPAASRCGVLC